VFLALVRGLRGEASGVLGRARREADEVLTKARRQAEQITGDARARAESLERDAQERHRQAMGSLVQSREELERRVDDLRAFEREYRSRLKAYLEGQLRDLEAGAADSGVFPAVGSGPQQSPVGVGMGRLDMRNGSPTGAADAAGFVIACRRCSTSALRRSPSVELIQALLKDGARVQAFDPHVSRLPDELRPVRLCADARAVAAGADALVVGNESPEFRGLSADDVAGAMKGRVVLDPGRFLGAALGADKRLSLISVGRVA